MSKYLIIANWKSNPDSPGRAVLLARKIERGILKYRNIEIVIAPPYPFLAPIAGVLRKAKLGSQNMFWEDIGPFTGEVSWHQLQHLRVLYVIIGHSERKLYLCETDEMINKKIRAALSHGLQPILCVGEEERSGREIPPVVAEQLKNALKGVKKSRLKDLTVAYEPIWAISTRPGARADTPDSAFRAMLFVRKTLSNLYGQKAARDVRVIYGGSVNSQNIGAFLTEGRMQGALVGGASLDPTEFAKIVGICSKAR